MTNTQCIVEGCEGVTYAKQLCQFHYGRQVRGKPLTDPKFVLTPQGSKCSVEGCHGKPRAKQLCSYHYERQKRGRPLDTPKRQIQGAECAVAGCHAKPYAKQLCQFHYQRQRNGAPLEAPKLIQPLGEKCLAPGCTDKPWAKDLCSRHYAEKNAGKEFSLYPKRRGKRTEIVCLKCETPKPVEEFPDKGVICAKCQSDDRKAHYRENSTKYKERNKANRIRLAQLVDDLKRHPCADCGQQYEPCCMELDHIGTKTMAIALMVHNTWGTARILEEIKQTELVCVLCHRTRTFLRGADARQNRRMTKVRERNLQIIQAYKEQPCAICGQQHRFWQMDFDHIMGEKKNCVSKLVAANYSTDAVLAEIAKCQVVCALCHRRKTFAEGGYKNY